MGPGNALGMALEMFLGTRKIFLEQERGRQELQGSCVCLEIAGHGPEGPGNPTNINCILVSFSLSSALVSSLEGQGQVQLVLLVFPGWEMLDLSTNVELPPSP